MEDDVECAVKSCKGFDAIREKAKTEPKLKREWIQAVSRTKATVEDRIKRLELKEKPFDVRSSLINYVSHL